MKVCAIADLHSNMDLQTPPADVLVVAGDLTYGGSLEEFSNVHKWLKAQPQPHKVIIAGNHDFGLQGRKPHRTQILPDLEYQCIDILSDSGIYYLSDSSVDIAGVKFYGSPWQPWFYNWAFNLSRGPEIAAKWDLIPNDVDVLITHGPPFGYGDRTTRGARVGCEDLLAAVERAKPRFHLFGHIHEDAGQWNNGTTQFINCSVGYRVNWHHPDGQPVVFEVNK